MLESVQTSPDVCGEWQTVSALVDEANNIESEYGVCRNLRQDWILYFNCTLRLFYPKSISMATTVFSHASIGKVKASTAKEGVIQCLGVQYATLADRFAPAAMRQYDSNGEIDATKLG